VEDLIRRAPLFSALDERSATELRACLTEIRVGKGRVLFREGEEGDQLFIVVSGKFKLAQAAPDGRENVLSVLGPGEMFGELSLFDPGLRTATARAMADSCVLALANPDLRPWLETRPEVAVSLLQQISHRLRRAHNFVGDLVFCDVPGRVAKAVLDLAGKFGVPGRDGVHVPHGLTQSELAQLVGASRETVNKALADFSARGWLRRESRAVVLLDVERLKRRAR
jgi:CRP/FNR family cyclic AMP-dependent transcriptional regulator